MIINENYDLFVSFLERIYFLKGNILPDGKNINGNNLVGFFKTPPNLIKEFIEWSIDAGWLQFDVAGANPNDKQYMDYPIYKTKNKLKI